MAVRKFPCVYMRGGTSKAVFFHKEDLPEEPKADVYPKNWTHIN